MDEHVWMMIISGGQTGVDRAALEAAIELQLPHGGWCPRGRMAEDGPIAARFHLVETEEVEYRFRTERNILDSDGTLVLHRLPIHGGTALTIQLAKKHRRPICVIDLNQKLLPHYIESWLAEHQMMVLNVAGPRESTDPGIGPLAKAFLLDLFARLPTIETDRPPEFPRSPRRSEFPH